MSDSTIPENVLEALSAVRASGLTNMLDRRTVAELCEDIADDPDARRWIETHRSQYMDALNAMAEWDQKQEDQRRKDTEARMDPVTGGGRDDDSFVSEDEDDYLSEDEDDDFEEDDTDDDTDDDTLADTGPFNVGDYVLVGRDRAGHVLSIMAPDWYQVEFPSGKIELVAGSKLTQLPRAEGDENFEGYPSGRLS